MLCFSTPSTGHDKGLFIAPAVTSVLQSCPLTAFVWSGCTCRPHCATQTLVRQRRTCFVPLCVVAFPATMLILSLPTLRACTQRFPLKLPLLGGLSSQQDVPPKTDLSRSREYIFSPLPTTKPHPPLPLTSGLWPHHVLYWLGIGWWRLGLACASLSNLSKSLPAAHVSAAT